MRPLLLQDAPPPEELERVRALCSAESASGDAQATYQLSFFSLGLGGTWQPEQAIPLIRTAANRDISEAEYWLAWQSEAGPLLPHDPAVALAWYQKAAAGRHRLALQRLADAYDRGELGLAVNSRRSLELRAEIRHCAEESARQSQ